VASLDRFLKIEGERPARDEAPRPAERARFADVGGGVESPVGPGEPQRSGGEPERFTPAPERPAEPPIRIKEDDGGQPFIRCRVCRCDNPVGVSSCSLCEADLRTPAQRSFNEALWDRVLAERAEYKQETERLEAGKRKTEAQYAAAMREMQRLRLGQFRWRGGSAFGLFDGVFADAGSAIARWLVRTFPDRRRRLLVLVGVLALVNLLTLWWLLGRQTGLTFWWVSLAIQLASVLSAFNRARRS
jgi:hypothetical protein